MICKLSSARKLVICVHPIRDIIRLILVPSIAKDLPEDNPYLSIKLDSIVSQLFVTDGKSSYDIRSSEGLCIFRQVFCLGGTLDQFPKF